MQDISTKEAFIDTDSRFYHYFKGLYGVCTYREGSWSTLPKYIVAIVAPDDAKLERLSLEEYLIERLQPVDNIHEKK